MGNAQFLYNLSARLDASTTAAFQQFEQGGNRAADRVTQSMARTGREVSGVADKFRAAAAGLAVFQGPLGGLASRLNATGQLFRFVGTAAGTAIGGIAGFGAALNAASGVQEYQAKLVAATKSQAEFANAQRLALVTARDTRSELGDTIQFYVRLASATNGLNISQKDLFQVLGTVQKSIQLSGAGAQEATAAMQQFSQAIGSASGLSGDEFKSLGENANKVLQVIAEGLVKTNAIPGFDGSIGALRKLGAEGQLTRDKLLPALAAMRDGVDDAFGRMPVTITQATNQLKTSLSQLIISAEGTFGVLNKTAGAIETVADNFRLIGGVATVAGVAIASRLVVPLVATGVAGFQAAGAIGAFTRSLVAVQAPYTLAGRAAMGFKAATSGVVGLLGGPWGVALTAAAGAAYFLATRETEAEKAARLMGVAQGDLATKVKELTGYILKQNDALGTNIDLQSQRGRDAARSAIRSAGQDDFAARLRLGGALRLARVSSAETFSDQGFRDLIAQVGSINPDELQRKLDALNQKFPKTFKTFGDAIYAEADKVAQSTATYRDLQAKFIAEIDKKDGLGAATERLKARGKLLMTGLDGNPIGTPKAKTKAQIDAEAAAAAIDDGTRSIAAAGVRRREAIANLEAQFPQVGKADAAVQADYAKQRSEIEERYRTEVEGIQAAAVAKRTATAAEKAANAAARAERRAAIADETSFQQILNRLNPNTTRQRQAEAIRIDAAGLNQKRLAAGLEGYSPEEMAKIEGAIQRFLVQPLTEANAAASEQATIQSLILAGREADAEVLQRANALIRSGVDASQISLDVIAQQVEGERQRNREIQRRNALIDIQARAVGEAQQAFTQLFATGNLKQFGTSLLQSAMNRKAQELSFKLFGNAEQDARDRANGALKVNTSALDNVRAALVSLESALTGQGGVTASLTDAVGGGTGLSPSNPLNVAAQSAASSAPALAAFAGMAKLLGGVSDDFDKSSRRIALAADQQADIVVTARRERRSSGGQAGSLETLLGGIDFSKVANDNKSEKLKKTSEAVGKFLDKALEAYGDNQIAGGIQDSIGFRPGGRSTGANVGRDIGGTAGAAAGRAFFGPVGGVVGGFLGRIQGGLIGSLFGGVTERAFQNINVGADGSIGASFGGARGKQKDESLKSAQDIAGTFIGQIEAITSAFGAKIAAGSSIGNIGVANGKFEFSTALTDAKGNRVGPAPTAYATAEEALAAGIKSVIERGLIVGIRQGTKNLLAASGDFNRQLDKATKFESVFTDLRRATDPVGAAVDDLNKKFLELADIFKEAQASAEDYAKLQQLYDIQRADALKTAGNAQLESLKAYLSDLTTGSDSGLSARDRRASALAAFTPFANDIAAGKSVDVEAYRTAAENLRSVERELFGSTQGYFDRLSQITDLTRQAIAGQSNVTSIADALNFNAPAQVTPITSGLSSLQQVLADKADTTNELLAAILSNGIGGGVDSNVNAYALRNF